MARLCWIVLALCLLAPTSPARAADDVDLALVLVTDVSRSIDDSEFALEKDGYAAAFTSDKVLSAIKSGPLGSIAVAYVEFASGFEVKTVLDWTVIRDPASAKAFVDRLSAAPRSYWGRTAISAGIDHAVGMLAESGYNASRRASTSAATAPTTLGVRSTPLGTTRWRRASPSTGWRSSTNTRCPGRSPMCSRRAGCKITIGRM